MFSLFVPMFVQSISTKSQRSRPCAILCTATPLATIAALTFQQVEELVVSTPIILLQIAAGWTLRPPCAVHPQLDALLKLLTRECWAIMRLNQLQTYLLRITRVRSPQNRDRDVSECDVFTQEINHRFEILSGKVHAHEHDAAADAQVCIVFLINF